MATGGTSSKTRSGGKVHDFGEEFPVAKSFTPSNKLPTYKSIVGMLRNLLEGKGQGRGVTVDMACREVMKQVIAKWFHDTVYHKSELSVLKMMKNLHAQYTEGKRKQRQGRLSSKDYLKFVQLFEKKDQLFDIYPSQEEGNTRITKCEEEWAGLRMNARDKEYYEDQKGPRVMVCENRCDPVFFLTWLKNQRELERK